MLPSTQNSDLVKIAPEELHVAETYLRCESSAEDAASELGVPVERVHETLAKPHVKRFVDQVFLDQGYRNRGKLLSVLEEMLESKLEEARADEYYTKADLLELMKFMWTVRQDIEKASKENNGPNSQTNIQVNNNYHQLLDKLLN